jgi:hypothetical protein
MLYEYLLLAASDIYEVSALFILYMRAKPLNDRLL